MENKETIISTVLQQNIDVFEKMFADCADIKMKRMALGVQPKVECFMAYIEVVVNNTLVEHTALGRLLSFLAGTDPKEIPRALDENAMGISDITYYATVEEAVAGLLTGDAILFVDGYEKALKIADKGYPGAGVQEPDSEKVIRGSKEGFTDSIKTNTALIRKRVRSNRVKVKEIKQGIRSHTVVDLVYMEDLANESVLTEIQNRLNEYEIDGVLDSGIIEQLAEKKWYSPFPQFQTTQRPDRAAMAVLEGRVVVMSDNSPTALIIPTDFNSFIKTSDDYYNRCEVASFARILRFFAVFFALTLPEEFRRVLRRDGLFFQVLAAEDHLLGLKSVLYDELTHKEKNTVPALPGFCLVESRPIRFSFTVEGAQLYSLFAMTPHLFRVGKSGVQRLADTSQLRDTASCVLNVYRAT